MKNTGNQINDFESKYHQGRVLIHLTDSFASILKVTGEIYQNILDSGGTNALIEINLAKTVISGYDNGRGETLPGFKKKLANIGMSSKGDDDSGEKGYGLFAGISILKKSGGKLIFISSTQRSQAYRFELPRNGLEETKVLSDIIKLTWLDQKTVGGGKWRTLQQIKGFTDASITPLMNEKDLARLIANEMATQFREKILKKKIKTTISVIGNGDISSSTAKIKPLKYKGRREDIMVSHTEGRRTEEVRLELYLTRSPQKNPKIDISYRKGSGSFPLKKLSIWKRVKDILGSGHFQGTLHVDFCEVNGPKDNFKPDPSLEILEKIILKFVKETAKDWIKRLQDSKRDENTAKLALDVLKSMDTFFKKNPEYIPDGLIANVSEGHNDADKGKDVPTKIRTRKKYKKREDEVPSLEEEKTPLKKKKKKNKGTHTGAESETGTKRKALRGETGLQLLRVEGDSRWMMKIGTQSEEKGKLLLNIAHPIYAEILDKKIRGNKEMLLFLGLLATKTVSLGIMNSAESKTFNGAFEEFFMEYRSILLVLFK